MRPACRLLEGGMVGSGIKNLTKPSQKGPKLRVGVACSAAPPSDPRFKRYLWDIPADGPTSFQEDIRSRRTHATKKNLHDSP